MTRRTTTCRSEESLPTLHTLGGHSRGFLPACELPSPQTFSLVYSLSRRSSVLQGRPGGPPRRRATLRWSPGFDHRSPPTPLVAQATGVRYRAPSVPTQGVEGGLAAGATRRPAVDARAPFVLSPPPPDLA